MSEADQSAGVKFVVTNTLIVRDVKRSVAFYRDVLGATVLREGSPHFSDLATLRSTSAVARPTISLRWSLPHPKIRTF
jgi:hypothetical protein